METIFDWLTVITFAGLAVLYLQRSAMPEPQDRIWHYLPPSIGCAVVNYIGNEGYPVLATIGLMAVFAYVYYFLKPHIRT